MLTAHGSCLRAQGPQQGGERYAEISKFLGDTEDYLNRLGAKVAAVKQTQAAAEAIADAVSRVRPQFCVLMHTCHHQHRHAFWQTSSGQPGQSISGR